MIDLVLFSDQITPQTLSESGFKEEGISNVKDYLFQRQFAKSVENEPTPYNITEEREGFKDKQGNPVMLEYIPEEYCISELNRLYPGWWCEGMKRSDIDEIIKLETVVVEGYLCVSYPLPSGRIAVEKRWGIADNGIKFLTGTKVPVDVGNNLKGAKTEWIRNVCKWYGIGLDIYHQHITPELRKTFEDLIRDWRDYAGYWINLAKGRTNGKGFRDMLKAMPTAIQVKRMQRAVPYFSAIDQSKLWKSFGTHSNAPKENSEKFETYLTKLEQIAQELKTKQ